jgi:hypothetical protein
VLSLIDKVKLAVGFVVLILIILMFKKEIKEFFLKTMKSIKEENENVGKNNGKL